MGLGKLFNSIAGAVSQALPAITGIFGTKMQVDSNNRNIDKQIAAQSRENQLTRDYNLNLAKLSNQWNIDQWNRENEYNSPAAQMARYAAAGLNPNLIYGQQNTSGQISGSLSAGAPASPVDMSALGSKRGIGEVFTKLGESMMEIPLYREQVRSARLDNEVKEIDLWNKDRDKYIRDLLANINGSDESITELLTSKEFEHSPYSAPEVRKALFEYRKMSASAQVAWLDKQLKSETFKDELKALASKYQLEDADAKRALSLMADLLDAERNELNLRKATKTFGQIVRADDFNFKYFIADLIDVILNAFTK